MPNYVGPKEEPKEWRFIRVEVYNAHKGTCYFCSKHVPESEQSLEGVLKTDGIHNKRNLVPAHPECHDAHHAKLRGLWGAR